MTESEKLEKELDRLKVKYFASKYTTVYSFAKYSGEWPEYLNASSYSHWNKEKVKLRDLEEDQLDAIQQNYKYTLIERINFAAKVSEIIEDALMQKAKSGQLDTKELGQLIRAMAHISDLQDRTMVTMKIDPSVDKQYHENAAAVDAILDAAIISDVERQEIKNEIKDIHNSQKV